MDFLLIVLLLLSAAGLIIIITSIRGNKIRLDNQSSNLNKDNDRETYFATLVHDLKTPAFAQIRTMDLLLKGYFGKLNDTQTQVIKETLASEKYMADIVTNILTTYKCEENKLKLEISCFDAADVLNGIYNSIKSLAEENNQILNINYHCSNLFCVGDKLQISRVMNNLISNAIKYGFKDSIINVNLNINDYQLEFNVENQGHPIPKSKLDKIFEKYTGGMAHYNSASTGLGLYLSKRIIELHNGKIYAKSSNNGKCVFGFVLPSKSKNLLPSK